MKLKIVALLALTGLVGGCTATITPRGDIYTEALLPAVVVESYPQPVFVSKPHRPAPRPLGPIVSGRRYSGHSSARHSSHGFPRGPQGPGRRH